MGAFILAGLIAVGTFCFALLLEIARGFATAPSMQPSYFWPTIWIGMPVAALVAASHWLPHIGW